MLYENLYKLSYLLSTPYNKLHFVLPDIDSFLNQDIIEEILLKKLLNFELRKKFNYFIENIEFKYTCKILHQNNIFIKLKFTLEQSFLIKPFFNDVISASVREYILIIENLNNKIKVQFLIEKEENPILYDYISNIDLDNIWQLPSINYNNIYTKKLTFIKSLYKPFNLVTDRFENSKRNSIFNIADACAYAQQFALNPNPNYKYFDADIGGDCSNFASQIINAGGINTTNTWKPYTYPWIRVENLYSYLISNNIGYKISENNTLSQGSLIQFYSPKTDRFSHTGFITYELTNGDYLYCCHSYNKLNYPLSAVFPIIYHKLRAVKFY